MTPKQEYDLKIDPEFESLHISPDESTIEKLEKNILMNGVFHPLVLWQGILVDGYKRYSICRKHHLSFPIRTVFLASGTDVMIWICDRMLLRYDLSEERRKYYIGKKFLLRSATEPVCNGLDAPVDNISDKYHTSKHKMARMIGADFNLSPGAVMKYGLYASALDTIRSQDPMIFEKIISGGIKISHENVLDISNLRDEDIRILHGCLTDKKRTYISRSEIWHELRWNRIHPTNVQKKKKEVVAPIKLMPKYDPDAEISSLTLTIPSWIKSIERTVNNADFPSATASAKHRLREQLRELWKAAEFLYSYTQEASHERNRK